MSKSTERTVCTHLKRISLRCPAAIASSSLIRDKISGKYSVKLTLENTGDNGVDNDTFESAAFIIRCIGENGENISFGENDYLMKTVKFADDGLVRADSVTMIVMLGADTEKLVDFEVYVNRIRFADGAVLTYLRADFFPTPDSPIPLSKRFKSVKVREAVDIFGVTAEFVPENLSEVVWRCTCGEICEDADCPMCGSKKALLFSFFGLSDEITVPKGDSVNRGVGKKLTVLVLAGVAVFLAVLLGVVFLAVSSGKKPEVTETQQTTTAAKTEEPGYDDATILALAYAEAHEYDNALAAAERGGCGEDIKMRILKEAAEYNIAAKNYVKAYSYASQIAGYENLPTLIQQSYNQCLLKGDYIAAAEYASLIGDADKHCAAIKALADKQTVLGDYSGAYATAVKYNESVLAEAIAEEGITFFLGKYDYDSAIELAGFLSDPERVLALNKEAVYHFLSVADYASASRFAAASGDEATLRELCDKLDNATIKKSLPVYFRYLTPERARAVLAARIGAGALPAVITPDGKLLYGAGEIYTPAAGKTVVSVSAGELHTVILLSDGTVVALGDNTYGQCDVSGLHDIVMISAGRSHTVALDSSGHVYAVGKNTYNQCSVGTYSGVTSISAGNDFTLLLLSNGSVAAIGNNAAGQCAVSSWKNIVGISAGSLHSVGITSDGTVVFAGSSLLEMSAVSSWTSVNSVSAGGSFTVGINDAGGVLITGALIDGSLGPVSALSGAVSVDAGTAYILALLPDGKLAAIGSAPDLSAINLYIANLSAPV